MVDLCAAQIVFASADNSSGIPVNNVEQCDCPLHYTVRANNSLIITNVCSGITQLKMYTVIAILTRLSCFIISYIRMPVCSAFGKYQHSTFQYWK